MNLQYFLTRAVQNVFPSPEKLADRMVSGPPLLVYAGIDPTGPTVHLGHVIWLRKLAMLQEMGYRVILLIGDFTAMIGDPTDKKATRKQLTREEVLANCKLYKEQAGRFLRFEGENPVELRFNSDWLAKMTFSDVIELSSRFTAQQMLERDMFQDRLREGKPIYMHEFMYPLMQGYDSVFMEVDLEIGGNDQTFNMLTGRTLLREMKNKEKYVLTTKLLVDPTGKKMGKSEGNMVTFLDEPNDIYGKIMSWSDAMVLPGYELLTDISDDELSEMKQAIEGGENPMQFKRELAKAIVRLLVSDEAAIAADAHFTSVHQKGEKPEEMLEYAVSSSGALVKLIDVLVEMKIVSSKTEARRQIEQGGVKVNDVVATDIMMEIGVGAIVQKGKRHFVRLV
ncbi:tyrosine--tRNA ligase [Candidatus Uhrbacteria bacterium]|nr:tyrosine--tRNA ligase [Candidatus Uhrbacteria bacterium]